jgi:hypothetical protein
MGKRGPKPKGKVKIKWSQNFAYAVGLIVTDGCLYNDGRHISLVSKDREQIDNYIRCLNLKGVKIGRIVSGGGKFASRIQFGDVNFYAFLNNIGVGPAKSKILKEINVSKKYFFDFLRGAFDGDGSFHSYWDKRWRSSHMFYLSFTSASIEYVLWLRQEILLRLKVKGYISHSKNTSWYQLKYAKKDSLEIIKKMYYNPDVVCLSRKRKKIEKALTVEGRQQKQYV